MQLNHLDLPVPDVAATAAFFERHCGFRLRESRGNNGMAILVGEGGFVLVLTRLRAEGADVFPDTFHIGFLLDSEDAVRKVHAGLAETAAATELSPMNHMRGAFLFFCRAPGDILIEVSHRPKEPA